MPAIEHLPAQQLVTWGQVHTLVQLYIKNHTQTSILDRLWGLDENLQKLLKQATFRANYSRWLSILGHSRSTTDRNAHMEKAIAPSAAAPTQAAAAAVPQAPDPQAAVDVVLLTARINELEEDVKEMKVSTTRSSVVDAS